MSLRTKIILIVASMLVLIGGLVFVFGPVLFASVAYPLPDQYRASLVKWTGQYCQGIDEPVHLMSALIMTESGWHTTSVSSSGAVGLTQFTQSTSRSVAKTLGVSPFQPNDLIANPDMAIQFGSYYICTRIKDYGGDVKKGLIAYNGGGGAVLAYEVGSPVRGTVAYANKIIALKQAYATIYGSWWTTAGTSGSATVAATPTQFTVQPKTDTSLISTVPLLDFWRGLVSNQSSAASSNNSTSTVNSFWKIFLPSSSQ